MLALSENMPIGCRRRQRYTGAYTLRNRMGRGGRGRGECKNNKEPVFIMERNKCCFKRPDFFVNKKFIAALIRIKHYILIKICAHFLTLLDFFA